MNRLRIQVAAFVVTRTVVNTIHRMIYPFLAVFGRGLGVDLATLSLALTARSAFGMVSPFLAFISDTRGRKTGMLIGLGLFLMGMALMLVWPSLPTFVLMLILTVLSKQIFDPSMQAYLGDRVPYSRRGLVVAATEIGWSLAFIAGIPFVGLLIDRGGWQAPFPVMAGAGVLVFLLLWWMLPGGEQPHQHRPGVLGNLRSVVTSPPAVAGLLVGLLISLSNETINLVFGVWMEDSFGLKIAALGAASAIIGISELGGEGLTAILADRLGKIRSVGLGVAANMAAVLLLPVLGRSLAGALLGLFLIYITFEFTLVSSLPLMTELLPEVRATLMAANIAGHSLGRGLGALVAVPIYGGGILASCFASLGISLLALLALAWLRRHFSDPHHDEGRLDQQKAN